MDERTATALTAAWADGRAVAVATVVETLRSAPRPPGSVVAVLPDGAVLGSVSGGCIDGDVYEAALDVLRGSPSSLRGYGEVGPEDLAAGVPCGGEIRVFVERIGPGEVADAIGIAADADGSDLAHVVATVVRHPDPAALGGRLVLVAGWAPAIALPPELADAVERQARDLLGTSASRCRSLGPDGEVEVFFEALPVRARLILVGATEHAGALARLGRALGRRVTVCDPRPVFTTPARFPAADDVVVAWPQRYLAAQAGAGLLDARTALVVTGHDPRTEVPTLAAALRLGLGYVGALGSRRTHGRRVGDLRAAGATEAELATLCSPAGLDLGGRTAEETALSVVAEIVARDHGGTGEPLRARPGPVHPDAGPGRGDGSGAVTYRPRP